MTNTCRHVLYAVLLLAAGLSNASAQEAAAASEQAPADTTAKAPTAKQICDEARANILRARLTYTDKSLQDEAYITQIFAQPNRRNEYHVELRDENEWQKRYPDFWMQGYYSMADEKLLDTPLMAHSVGEQIHVQATVSDIDFINHSSDAPAQQRPACRLGVRIDWDKAVKPKAPKVETP